MVIESTTQLPAENVIALLNQKFGTHTIKRLRQQQAAATRETPFSNLNQNLAGGLVKGGLVHLIAADTSGAMTFGLMQLAQTQMQGEPAIYIDCHRAFDASYATRHQLNLDELLVIRPDNILETLRILQTIGRRGTSGVVVIDSLDAHWQHDHRLLPSAMQKVAYHLRQSDVSLLVLSDRRFQAALAPVVAVQLAFEREAWLWEGDDVRGCRSAVTILRNRTMGKQATVTLDIPFNPTLDETDTSWHYIS